MVTQWTVILDVGQFTTKIGWGGENEPRNTFYTITGTPKYTAIGTNQAKQIYVGNEIADAMGLYKISYPIQNGDIVDWEMFKSIIDYVFYYLRVDPTAVNLLYMTNPFLSWNTKQKLFEMFLGDYQVMGFYPVRGALLTMYSGGFDTGLVVDMGTSHLKITPIYQGFLLNHAVTSLELGGSVLDNFMMHQCSNIGMNAETSAQKELVRVLKERACFCSLDFESDIQDPNKYLQEYALPDGSTIKIGSERFLIPELIFDPSLNNIELPSLPEAIINCVELCDLDIRQDLLQNIFLTGGSSMFPRFETRLKQELERVLLQKGKNPNVRIIAPSERVFSNWIGGSILSKIPEFQNSWVSRKQYYEEGIPEEFQNS